MKARIDLKLQLANVGLVAALGVTGSAVAQTFPKEGTYDYTACWSGVNNPIEFSKTHSAVTQEFTGTTRSNPPGGFLDNRSFRCIGLATMFDGKGTNTTVCESLGADGGDKILTRFSVASDGKATREVIAGTGKYEGLVSSGIAEPLGPFPSAKLGTFQACNHQTGTYKMK
jgi:hypothetical protein